MRNDRIVRLIAGLGQKSPLMFGLTARAATINGLPGFVLGEADGSLDTIAFEHHAGQIVAIYFMRNPEKLRHVRF
jgi:RNA polymerase sigma-70 factor (ECF subfamily)